MNQLGFHSSLTRKAGVTEAQDGNTVENNFVKHKVFYMPTEEFFKTYHEYKYNRGNGTDESRAREIARSFNPLLAVAVVADSKSKTILDGHHFSRAIYIAVNEMGKNIPEILVQEVALPKGMTVGKAVQLFNNNRKGWDLSDYIENYINEGYADYRRLKQLAENLGPFFHEDTKYRWRYTAALSGRAQQDKLRDGLFKMSSADFEEQFNFGREAQALWEVSGSPKVGPWAEPYIIALWQVKDNLGKIFNFNRLLEAFKKYGKQVFDNSSLSTKVWKDRINSLYIEGKLKIE